jgi:stage V sporulation protein R
MTDWKRDIIEVCRDEGRYFWPQIQTKIMNEGWASYWHYTILHELELPPELHVAFIKSHNQVIRPHIGGINPYHLGFHLFQRIKERKGMDECFIAREVHNDASFIRQYLTQADCEDLNLFSYSKKKSGDTSVDDVSDEEGWEEVRRDLVHQVGGGSIPILNVEEAKKNGDLVLAHEHDGRDLDIGETKRVLDHLYALWDDRVLLHTIVDGKRETLGL